MRASVSARTELLSGPLSNLSVTEDEEEDRDELETVRDAGDETPRNNQPEGEAGPTAEQSQDELAKQLRDIESYVQKERAGALNLGCLGLFGPPLRPRRLGW